MDLSSFLIAASAHQALQHINGYTLEGKVVVRVVCKPPPPGGAGFVPNSPQPTGFPEHSRHRISHLPGRHGNFIGPPP